MANPKSSPVAARAGISVSARVDEPLARRLIHEAMRHEDESVVQLAIHAASVNRDATASGQLLRFLDRRTQSLHNRRAAAEAFGRVGSDSHSLDLTLALEDRRNDRCLDHSLTYASMELGNPSYVNGAPSRSLRASLMACDQTHGKLTPEVVLPCLDDADAAVRDAASWVAPFLFNRCLTIAGGTSDIQRNVIAERLLGLPRDP